MKKEQESKIMICLYVIIGLLILNTICHGVVISKIGKENKVETSTTKETSENQYDISMFTSLTPAEITKKIKSGDEFVLFIGQEKCTYCQKILPTLQQAQKDYNYTTVYLNIAANKTTTDEYKEMAALLDVKKTANGETKKFGEFQLTPMMAVIRDGKMIDGMIGYNTYENFADFLESSGMTK